MGLRLLAVFAMIATSVTFAAQQATAVPSAVSSVIDDFEDPAGPFWGFFGGNLAGGGGGLATDRPHDGAAYLSTGWGGQGSNSVFYGGAFRNFDNAAQPALPADPWFNVWVLNQSDATADAYTLEITLREDTNGDGWTDTLEDSVRLDTTFTSADFDDQWTLISAPLSSMTNLGTGGDGVFNGDLDEVVIVVSGVAGADPSTVELDFDTLSFTSGGPSAFDTVVLDDMEHGDPFGNGWFAFNGSVGGGGLGPNADVAPTGGAFSIDTGWGSGGTAGFYGGFGRAVALDASGTEYLNFWINPLFGDQTYTIEINLQDDDNGDGAPDDEFQYDCVVAPVGGCATAGGGWQQVSIPLTDFFLDTSQIIGGNGVLDPTSVARGGNGGLTHLVNVVIGTGTDANFRLDDITLTRALPGAGGGGAAGTVVEDFEAGVGAAGPCPPGAPPLGFCTFNDAGSTVAISTTTAETPPGAAAGNAVLQMDLNVAAFAGFINGFSTNGVDWTSQDWSTSQGITFWMKGTGSGTTVFVDIIDNRNPGSTTDDGERFVVEFLDDFVGWQQLQFPFSAFARKEIGNGAPNDGLGLFEMHGWAIGTVATGGPLTLFVDDFGLYGVAEPPAVAISLVQQNTYVEEGASGAIGVKLNRPLGPDDPAEVSIDYRTEPGTATPGEEYVPVSGTLTFTRGGPTELSFPFDTFDDSRFEGDERVVLRLTNPVGAERGSLFQGSALIDDNDPVDPNVLDEFTQGAYLWDAMGPATIAGERLADTDPNARPGQDAFEDMMRVDLRPGVEHEVEGDVCARNPRKKIRIRVFGSDEFDATKVQLHSVRFGEAKDRHVFGRGWVTRFHRIYNRHVRDVNRDGFADLTLHFRSGDVNAGCEKDAIALTGQFYGGEPFTILEADPVVVRDLPIGQDWSRAESLSFWYQGTGDGEEVTVTLKDNRVADPGPAGWDLVWSDEFDEPAGTAPNPANWTHEVGDVTPDGKNGWGNDELQYYTDDPANAATDGDGNLVITLREGDGSQECYYGPCAYTSARLLTQHKAEFAYGRIESRLRVPNVGTDLAGLWPAFWSLGTDITSNPWPGAGEIDVMEWVGRLPNEYFGTIHGPGYAGGASFGGFVDHGEALGNAFHTFTVEWEPDVIRWYMDDVLYHTATPADVAPNEWVFDKPFFLLLNFAIGGNFGGNVGPDVLFPQEYLVDYVRVYQGPDTAERFEAEFTDDVAGWQEVTIPFTAFERSDDQPDGAPDDGLTLTDVWGYGFEFDDDTDGSVRIDAVRLVEPPAPVQVTVTTADDASLRDALATVADGGTVTLAPALAGQVITLTGGQLVLDRSVTIDGSLAPGVVISGGGASRVMEIGPTAVVAINDVTIADGVGAPQGGGVRNLGSLALTRVVVSNNTVPAVGAPNFEFGGGGIYNGDSSTLTLTDSTVADNSTADQPGGGIYGFFNSSITITNSVVSGNVGGDVAGGLRSLGNVTINGSTFTGNVSTAWHGGGIFHTDGQLTVDGSTFDGNVAPAGTASGILVATFGAPANMTISNSVVNGGGGAFACGIEGGGAATITDAGGNTDNDGSCGFTP